MAKFSRFIKSFKPIATLEKPKRTRSRFRTSRSSFLRSFSRVARTYQRKPIIQARQISAYLPQAQVLDLSRDKKLEVPRLRQWHNECGPTSLAMIMEYYGIDAGNYHNMFGSDTVGHGPLALAGKARAKNMLVRYENYGSVNDIVQHIDNGCPVTVLGINGGCNNLNIENYLENATKGHWVDAVGYKTNDLGQVTHVYVNNPNNPYYTECWSKSKFESFWNYNSIPGGRRFHMVFAKKGTMQESLLRRKLPSNKVSDTFKVTLETVDALEDAFYALEAAGLSFFDAIRDAVGDVVDEVGDFIEDAADAVGDAAEDVWDEVSSWF
jgi:hypothetical protein